MKYTLEEIREILIKEIKQTQNGVTMMIESDPDNESLYQSFNGLDITTENINIIFDNLIENES